MIYLRPLSAIPIVKFIVFFLTFLKNIVFQLVDTRSLKLLICPRLGLSHLNVHKFNHSFCSLETETTSFLFFHHDTVFHVYIFNKVKIVFQSFDSLSDMNKLTLCIVMQ